MWRQTSQFIKCIEKGNLDNMKFLSNFHAQTRVSPHVLLLHLYAFTAKSF